MASQLTSSILALLFLGCACNSSLPAADYPLDVGSRYDRSRDTILLKRFEVAEPFEMTFSLNNVPKGEWAVCVSFYDRQRRAIDLSGLPKNSK